MQVKTIEERKQIGEIFLTQLKLDYPIVETPLIHQNVYELLAAVILSPQTPDETTNKVTPKLFAKYKTPYKLSKANEAEVLEIIKSVNYNRTKSKNLIKAMQMIVEKFDGKVPYKMSDLILLPGVGRKVANVVISEWYARSTSSMGTKSDAFSSLERGSIDPEGFVVDTHVLRVSKLASLTNSTDVYKVEKDLMEIFPRIEWAETSLRMIFHGRNVMQARNPEYKKYPFWKEFYSKYGNIAAN